ncbi:MAG: selenium cofactor biosynthesis protein YqeC [bacterium]|nr:selenium cofactor biosynthesis protein YqeC [bacterium]
MQNNNSVNYSNFSSAPLCIAIIGSGGKTTLMNSLAQICPGRVLMTTTTHLAYPDSYPACSVSHQRQSYAGRFIPFDNLADFRQAWSALSPSSPLLTARLDSEKKHLLGLEPAEIDALSTLPQLDVLIAEADGSKRLPIKAHRPGEPVLFPSCNLGIAVIGMTAIGRQVCPGQVHRPELLQKLLRCSSEHRLTPQDLAAALLAYLEKFSCSQRLAVLSQGEHCPEEYTKETEKAVLRLLEKHTSAWARRTVVTRAKDTALALEKFI